MKRNYTVHTRIMRPADEVYNAIVESNKLCQYFTSKSSADFAEGQQIYWEWQHYDVALPVTVKELVPGKLIRLALDSSEWKKTIDDPYTVEVIFELEALDEHSTMLAISETGWKTNEEGLKGSHDNCGGWTHMAMCLKAWIEHGIDLR